MKEVPAVTVGPNGEVEVNLSGSDSIKRNVSMPTLPKPLTLEEKKYLLAVERGDMGNVRRILQKANRKKNMNMNCVDPLGRGALSIAIDGENLEMLELLVVMGVETRDSLLQAINVGFVEAVELLLEHEELVHKDGEPYSWETVDRNTAQFTPDITPLILAAHRNNYEILKILLDRGATLPMPHEVKCGCEQCIRDSEEDSLRFSMSRINEYKALASPSLIALSSNDPVLTAFELSWDLRNLAFAEQESKVDYMELRRQCQQLAVSLLDQTRSSTELAIILNHDPDSPPYEDGEHMKLARLELAITYKQKKFVAHPNIQQLLASIWYEGLPGFRRKSLVKKLINLSSIAFMFPFYCMLYIIAPNTSTGKLMRKPFMKFLIHASSYLFFLLILILVSQRVELLAVEIVVTLFGNDDMKRWFEEEQAIQRGKGPMILECLVGIYVLGFIWEETMEIWTEGMNKYLRNMWNFIDFTRNALYVAVFVLRCTAYIQQNQQIAIDPSIAYVPREEWDAFDPQLIAEGLFAAANVFSALKLVHMFSINPHLGPLQISLGRMVIDIVKFFFIYSLVLFAFACGLNQLLWYFAELERRKCYSLPGGLPDWDNKADSCNKWRSFGNLFESSQSLFWASFGGVGIEHFELTGIKAYTRFWGLLMFGSYSVINVIVLLNLLIAMMSNSYAVIDQHSDTEWKFARTKLWLSYFEESATLPPPFNIFPTPKILFKCLGLREKDKMRRMSTKRKERKEKERDFRYTAVMRSLVWRYISAMQRQADDNPVTEDDVNEIKGEITTMRYELLEVLERNGLDVSSAAKKDKSAALGRKMKVWERRLMKDFHLAPVAAEEDDLLAEPPPDEDMLAKFRRIAKLAVLSSAQQKWGQVVKSACKASQIGRCNNRDAFRSQQTLQKAMAEAQKLIQRSPKNKSRAASPSMSLPDTTTSTMMELLKDFETEGEQHPSPRIQGRPGGGTNMLLRVKKGVTPQTSPRITKSPSPSRLTVKDMDHSGGSSKAEEKSSSITSEVTVKPLSLGSERTIPQLSVSPPPRPLELQVPDRPVSPTPPPVLGSPPGKSPISTVSASSSSPPTTSQTTPPKITPPSCAVTSRSSIKETSTKPEEISTKPKISQLSPSTSATTTEITSPPRPSTSSTPSPRSPSETPCPPVIPTDSTNSNNMYSVSSSSVEPLIPPESPKSPRTSEFKPVKRQQKEGWL